MKSYIGTKIIKAEPMSEGEFLETYKDHPAIIERGRPGYVVIYEDGYTSWSPKETFERAYREVTPEEKKLINN